MTFVIFSFIGVGTMQRLFGTDILHTWVLGFVEACVSSITSIDTPDMSSLTMSPTLYL